MSTRGWALFAGLGLCLAAVAARGESLRIATYNVENYGLADRMTEDGYRQNYPKPESEKAAVRAVIRALNADVLALQEIGGEPYLAELRRDLKAEGIDYPYEALASAADEARHTAVLSKRPLVDTTTHADLQIAYSSGKETVKRGLLETSVQTPAGKVTLFVVHLKSRYTDDAADPESAARRAAEASAVRDRVLKKFPDPAQAQFVIVGDCNDGSRSKTLGFLQKRGKTDLAVLLPATDSRGETWTHNFRREDIYSRVDHCLISPGLLPYVRNRAAGIFDADPVSKGSDHRPVFFVLDFSKN